MAVSMQWKLLAAAAALSALAFGACGDDKSDPADDGKKDAGSGGGADGGGVGSMIIADLDDGVAGKTCTATAECGGKNTNCTIAMGQTQGVCSGACQTNDQCGAGGKCVSFTVLGQTIGSCQKPCSAASECSTGQECREGADIAGAIDRATDGGGIGIDASVDMSSTCQVIPKVDQLAAGVAGKACAGDSACGEGRCMTEYKITLPVFGDIFKQTYPGGYCTGDCLENAQCGAGAACVGASPGAPGMCLQTCTEHTDCRAEYACNGFRTGQNSTTAAKYCGPGARTAPEAGVSDAGAADAGAHDAGAVDAAADATAP